MHALNLSALGAGLPVPSNVTLISAALIEDGWAALGTRTHRTDNARDRDCPAGHTSDRVHIVGSTLGRR